MVTKGFTAKQKQFGLSPRLIRLTKSNKQMLEKEHSKFEGEILDDCYIGDEPWIDYFETYYLAEYSPFSKPFIITKRIKEFQAGKKIIYDYQIVYKSKGKNAPSPVRDYLRETIKKIDDAFQVTQFAPHLKKHLEYKLQEKHIESLRNYIKAKKQKGELK